MLLNIPPVVKNLLIINILMLLVTFVVKATFSIDLNSLLGLYFFESENFEPYQYVTYMFMHGGLMHIFFNMFALWMFGRVLEQVWGGKRFFLYYMVTGLGAALTHTFAIWFELSQINKAAVAFANTPDLELFISFIQNNFPEYFKQIYDKLIVSWETDPENPLYIQQAIRFIDELIAIKLNVPTVGASGAVFGILLAFGVLFPNTELMLIFPPIPIKAKYFVIIYGVIEFFAGVSNQPGDNVAHFAHLGGMVFGFILLKYWGINQHKKFN